MAVGHQHHRNSESIINDFLVGQLNLSTTPVEVKVGTTILAGRKLIYIVNDSSNIIFVNKIPSFSASLESNITIYSGETVILGIESNPVGEPTRFYARIEEGSNFIKVIEVK